MLIPEKYSRRTWVKWLWTWLKYLEEPCPVKLKSVLQFHDQNNEV